MLFETTVLIERPVAEVFEACDNARIQIAWIGSLVEVQVPEGTDWCPGARFRQVHEDSGMRQEFEGLLLDRQRDSRIEFQLEHGDLSVHTTLTFEDLHQRARLNQVAEITLHSLALKLAKAMFKSVIQQRMEEDLERLKALLESNS